MARAESGGPDDVTGIRLVEEDDGRVTAIHEETGVASFGESVPEALRELADALDSHLGCGDPIDDPEAYLDDHGVDAEIGSEGNPPWIDDE